MENYGVMKAWPFSRYCLDESVSRDQEIVSLPIPKHLYPHQSRSHNDGVESIYTNTIHGLKPRKWTAILCDKTAIGAKLGDGTPGFYSAQHVSLCILLVFDGYCRLAEDACRLQPSARARSQA
jgi:hypothetical protein